MPHQVTHSTYMYICIYAAPSHLVCIIISTWEDGATPLDPEGAASSHAGKYICIYAAPSHCVCCCIYVYTSTPSQLVCIIISTWEDGETPLAPAPHPHTAASIYCIYAAPSHFQCYMYICRTKSTSVYHHQYLRCRGDATRPRGRGILTRRQQALQQPQQSLPQGGLRQ
jgi:hypothetical protein